MAFLAVMPSFVRAEETLPQRYLDIYVRMHDSENLEKKEDYVGALKGFQDCYDELNGIHQSDPEWESALVGHRLSDVKVTIARLQDELKHSSVKAPTPDAAPLAQGTTPPTDLALKNTPAPQKPKNKYPWKTGIFTTFFYIGDESSAASAWNENWLASNHGKDDPDNRNGFASGSHASSFPPFYVALPFNDLAYPVKARQWLPQGWQRPPKDGKPVSACKDRWVEIKTEDGTGHICYAQWEDVGPNGNDHAEYVFGPEKPDTGNRAGLDVSPAVAQYLGLSAESHPLTRWRFVDDEDVPPGQWLKLDEQAVIYTAMHQ